MLMTELAINVFDVLVCSGLATLFGSSLYGGSAVGVFSAGLVLLSNGAYSEQLQVPDGGFVGEAPVSRLKSEKVFENVSGRVHGVGISFGCP